MRTFREAGAGNDGGPLAVRIGLPVVPGDDGRPDLAASLAAEAELLAAGATEVTLTVRAFAHDRPGVDRALAALAGS